LYAPPIVDGHLDLAENVTLFGLDLTLSIEERKTLEKRTTAQATVSLPELERGGIAVIFATVTAGFLVEDVGQNFEPRSALYRTPEQAKRRHSPRSICMNFGKSRAEYVCSNRSMTWSNTCSYGRQITSPGW